MKFRMLTLVLALPLSTQAFAQWQEVFSGGIAQLSEFGTKGNNYVYVSQLKPHTGSTGIKNFESAEKCIYLNFFARYVYIKSEQYLQPVATKQSIITTYAWNHKSLYNNQWWKEWRGSGGFPFEQGNHVIQTGVIDLDKAESDVCVGFAYSETDQAWINSLKIYAHP